MGPRDFRELSLNAVEIANKLLNKLWKDKLTYLCDVVLLSRDYFHFFVRFAINPLDKTVEQRTRGYFIAGSSTEVKRYEKYFKFNFIKKDKSDRKIPIQTT